MTSTGPEIQFPQMRIGLPRALLYYRYGRFWEEYLSGLGADVVLSRPTDADLLQRGLAVVSSEVCLPIKIAAGHVLDLADRVDTIFLPRMFSLDDGLYACPKMIGIVDVCRMMLGNRVRLIAPVIKGDLYGPHFRAGLAICRNPFRVAQAISRARAALEEERPEPAFPKGEKRVALIGHFYNTGDGYVADAIIQGFRSRGYRVVCKDDLPQGVLRSRAGFSRNIRWVYERELYNAFRFLVDKVSGVCVIVSMGCGPDSLVAEFMREEAQQRDVPFLQLVVDEHTGTAGIVTRVEAFLELAERRRARASACRLKIGGQGKAA